MSSAFVLHVYPYRETSLLVEVFTQDCGRMALLARGARRPRSEVRGVLRAFQPLLVTWSGNGEVKTLNKVEWQGGMVPPTGSTLMSGFYLNELLLRFLPREDPHPALYAHYEATLHQLSEGDTTAAQALLLRRFEVQLLADLGYALHLTHEAAGDSIATDKIPIDPKKRYHYVFESGACPFEEGAYPEAPVVFGATLLALADADCRDSETAREARLLMTRALDHFLENRPLFSRQIARELSWLRRQAGQDRSVANAPQQKPANS